MSKAVGQSADQFDAEGMPREVQRIVGVALGQRLQRGLIVAVSGGVDSVVLLDLLWRLKAPLNIDLHVAHLDHQLRPDSAADGKFVTQLARQRGLPCTVERRDVAGEAQRRGWSLEEAGRRLRYQFFEQVAATSGSALVALGHHADDQAETVLWRLLRGSGTTGLGAMEQLRQKRYLRPLLGFERAAIEQYATKRQLAFRKDSSNSDKRFVRNRVRAELIPYLKSAFNPQITRTLNRTAELLKEEDRLLEQMAQTALEATVCVRSADKIVLDAQRILDYHIALQRRVARKLLEGLSTREGPFDFAQVEALLKVWRQPASGLRQLAGELQVQRVSERIYMRRGAGKEVRVPLVFPGHTTVPERDLVLASQVLPLKNLDRVKAGLNRKRVAFDADALSGDLVLRTPRPGDRFCPLGMQGRQKKLSDYLIDSKVPRILRDEVLLLTCGEEIAWVVGMRPSHLFRLRADSASLLLIEIKAD